MGLIIRSVGVYSPQRVLTNQDLEEILKASGQETSDEWIVKRTGIHKRRVASDEENNGTMAVEAAKDAIARAGSPKIEYIILATNTSDRNFPNDSGFVQRQLRGWKSSCIDSSAPFNDIPAGCGGINIALMQADALIKAGFYKTVLVVGVDKLSSVTDYSDRTTAILFGDGASAYLLERGETGGFVGHYARGDGLGRELISCEENQEKVTLSEALRAVAEKRSPIRSRGRVLRMDGRSVFKYVKLEWKNVINGFRDNASLNPDRISFGHLAAISPHLANYRNLEGLNEDYPGFLEKCGLVRDYSEHFCNTSTASQGRRVRLFLEQARPGEHILMGGYGSGLISCFNLYQNP